MSVPIIQVDAFTAEPFRGNPAAVCLLEKPAGERWMQQVALEMNLSETAFLVPAEDGYSLRWFTPAAEVDLCGHATLASAHVLWEQQRIPADRPARFHTKSGLLVAEKHGDAIEMDFPAEPAEEVPLPVDLQRALGGLEAAFVGMNRMDYLAELDSERTVRELKPDFKLIAGLPEARGVIVTARADDDGGPYDFVSRCFFPAYGIDEDPVTGSAHCALGPYWAEKLGQSDDTLVGFQASARGGVVRVRCVAGCGRVKLGGQAVTVLRGQLIRETD